MNNVIMYFMTQILRHHAFKFEINVWLRDLD